MKKKTIAIGIFLFSILIFTFNCGITTASDDNDEDGIKDSYEELNRREIEYTIESNEISIESVRKSNKMKDLILANIAYDEDGLRFEIGYKSKLELELELIFGISFRELIEFVDVDFNGVYNPEVDLYIQNVSLTEFSPVFYENSTCLSGSVLHHFQIQTENETFTAHIYLSEEFTLVEDALILPTQVKIDLEISNFTFINPSSQLALYTRLESEHNFERQEETEDEIKGYAESEEGIITTSEEKVGFFSWKSIAEIDNESKNILTSEILPDDYIEDVEKLYTNYINGSHIYHSSKIGIEGILLSEKSSIDTTFITLAFIIGALSVVAAYSIYYAMKHKAKTKIQKRPGEDDYKEFLEAEEFDYVFDSKLALQILLEKNAIEKLYPKGDINLTTISKDFYEIVNQFNFEEHERIAFIREILSLSPQERELFMREMIIESQ